MINYKKKYLKYKEKYIKLKGGHHQIILYENEIIKPSCGINLSCKSLIAIIIH